MSIANDGVHMQYSSPPHQHDPGLSSAGCPPCHVRSCPWGHDDAFCLAEDIKSILDGKSFTKIPTTANIVIVARIAKVLIAFPLFSGGCLLVYAALDVIILVLFDEVVGRL